MSAGGLFQLLVVFLVYSSCGQGSGAGGIGVPGRTGQYLQLASMQAQSHYIHRNQGHGQ